MNDHSVIMNDHSPLVKGSRISPLRAALITEYGKPLEIADVADPIPPPRGIVLEVEATGICRSDWHAWVGHEDLPGLPHVPGHEMAGTIAAVGPEVERWAVGERVTVPFSIGCGDCDSCRRGHLNTCDNGFTPGFTHWGSFAQYVALDHADLNLIRLPQSVSSTDAAALGCRFATAFRALLGRADLRSNEWLVVHGCGGVGLSAVMIGSAIGAGVVAVDIDPGSLDLAQSLGASHLIDARRADLVSEIGELTSGGADVSVDAVGTTETMANSIASLRKHGRHVQVGLLLGDHSRPPIAMNPVIMGEIDILGSRGMAATSYPEMFDYIDAHDIDIGRLVTARTSLSGASDVLSAMGGSATVGVTVIDDF